MNKILLLGELLRRSSLAAGFLQRVLVFLIFVRVTLHRRHRILRLVLQQLIDLFTTNSEIKVAINLEDRALIVAIRNEDDDQEVFSELVTEDYRFPCEPPDFIVDAGANIGMFTLVAGARFPDTPIVCFEPNPENFKWLVRNIRENNLNAELLQAAVWVEDCSLELLENTPKTSQVARVEGSGGDVLGRRPEIRPNTWLKIDIEGGEYDVIPNLIASEIIPRWISMELHYFNERGDEILQLLQERGYRIHPEEFPDVDCVVLFAELSDG